MGAPDLATGFLGGIEFRSPSPAAWTARSAAAPAAGPRRQGLPAAYRRSHRRLTGCRLSSSQTERVSPPPNHSCLLVRARLEKDNPIFSTKATESDRKTMDGGSRPADGLLLEDFVQASGTKRRQVQRHPQVSDLLQFPRRISSRRLKAVSMSASDASTRQSLSWWRARNSRSPMPRRNSSALSILDRVSIVTGVP